MGGCIKPIGGGIYHMELNFKKCSEEDFEDFYILRCDKENIYWTGHDKEPNKDSLYEWYTEQLRRNDRIMFIARTDGLSEPIGYLYLDIIGNTVEISYAISSKEWNHGFGTKLILFSIKYSKKNLISIKNIYGWVFDFNYASIRCFEKNRFVKSGEIKLSYFEPGKQYFLMSKYEYSIE